MNLSAVPASAFISISGAEVSPKSSNFSDRTEPLQDSVDCFFLSAKSIISTANPRLFGAAFLMNYMTIGITQPQFKAGEPREKQLKALEDFLKKNSGKVLSADDADLLKVMEPIFATRTADQAKNLKGIAEFMNSAKLIKSTFTIASHSDSAGSEEVNKNLTQRRAEAVKVMFQLFGVDGARLTAVGYGESKLLLPETGTSAERLVAKITNRRIEIIED